MKMFKKTIGLKHKLKQATRTISDGFGYEKKITKNVIRYVKAAAKEHRIAEKEVVIRIVKQQQTVRVFLYREDKVLKEIPVKVLVGFFTGKEVAALPGIENRVINGIMGYMDGFVQFHELRDDRLQICIVTDASQVKVSAYHHHHHIKDIPIKALINYFTR